MPARRFKPQVLPGERLVSASYLFLLLPTHGYGLRDLRCLECRSFRSTTACGDACLFCSFFSDTGEATARHLAPRSGAIQNEKHSMHLPVR